MARLEDVIGYGTHAARPAAGSAGTLYYETDTETLFRDNGATWDALTFASGAAGALTQIDQVVLTGSAADILFSDIAADYSSLLLDLVGRSTEAANASSVYCQFNADTGANYDYQELHAYTSSPAASEEYGQTAAKVGIIPAASATANVGTVVRASIVGYANTTFQKSVESRDGVKWGTSAGSMELDLFAAHWRSTAAIDAIKLFLSGGSFAAGTVATLYGLS